MVTSPQKRRQRQLKKQERRKLRRRYSLFNGLPRPETPILLRMEPYFVPQDSFDLTYGHGHRSRQIARQLNELAIVLNGEIVNRDNAAPAPLLGVSPPSRLRHRKLSFPLSLFQQDSIPSRLYELKVQTGQVERAEGQWIAMRRPHLASLVGERHLRRSFLRTEYLLRANGTHLEVFSLTYRPLFSYRLETGPFTASNFYGDVGQRKNSMLKAHERAALIPAEARVPWYSFLKSRFVEPLHTRDKAVFLAIAIQAVQQHSPSQADIVGWMEFYSGSSLPVVLGFVGQLNLEGREFSIRQDQSGKLFTGQISENGLVMVLRETGNATQIHLVHEPTLAQLV